MPEELTTPPDAIKAQGSPEASARAKVDCFTREVIEPACERLRGLGDSVLAHCHANGLRVPAGLICSIDEATENFADDLMERVDEIAGTQGESAAVGAG